MTRHMSYAVKELYLTVQGEGAQTGRPAVFLRFAGCNLWSGREEDREKAFCSFCDTDFTGLDGPGGGRYDRAQELAQAARALWPDQDPEEQHSKGEDHGGGGCEGEHFRQGGDDEVRRPLGQPWLVCTGGEPFLQLDEELIHALHMEGFFIAVETNGSLPAPKGLDWITVSPKAGVFLRQTSGDELKLVFPQQGLHPEEFEGLDFQIFSLQPLDNAERDEHAQKAYAYCLENPKWRLSLQTHKWIHVP